MGQFRSVSRLNLFPRGERAIATVTHDINYLLVCLSLRPAGRPSTSLPFVALAPVLLHGCIAPAFLYAPSRTFSDDHEQRRTRQKSSFPFPRWHTHFPSRIFPPPARRYVVPIGKSRRQAAATQKRNPHFQKHPASETSHRSAHSCSGIFSLFAPPLKCMKR